MTTLTLPEPTPQPTAREVALDLIHALAAAHATYDANRDTTSMPGLRLLVARRFVTAFRPGTTVDQIAAALTPLATTADADLAPVFAEVPELRPFFEGEVVDVR